MPLLRRAAIKMQSEHAAAVALAKKAGLTLARMACASRLSWAVKSMTAADVQVLCSCVVPHVPQLEELDMRSNAIGDRGLLLLAAASARGHLPRLRTLSLSNNAITDEGATAFAAAVSARDAAAFAGLGQLTLEFNAISATGLTCLARALGDGALPRLSALFLTGNPGDDQQVQHALSFPSSARTAAGGGGYLGGMLGTQVRCCRAAKREHRGFRFF